MEVKLKDSIPVKTRQVIELLKERHQGMEWASFVELNVETGRSSSRLDFFAMNCWPSKRFRTVAYEIKVTRADFARELKHPDKRVPAEELGNECFFVMPAGLAKVDEIPEGWGLIEVIANGLRIKKHARQREIGPFPLSFMASIARRSKDDGPLLPKPYWLHAGKELDEAGVLALTKEVYEAELQHARSSGFRDGQEVCSKQYGQHRLIHEKLYNRIKKWPLRAEDVQEWLDGLDSRPSVMEEQLKENLLKLQDITVSLLGDSVDKEK